MTEKKFWTKVLILALFIIGISQTFMVGYGYYDSLDANKQDSLTIGNWWGIGISTPQEFYDFVTNPNSTSDDNYFLENDIDFTGFTWNYDNTNYNVVFRGLLNGNGHTISNLTINLDNTTYNFFGLFPYMEGGTITNIAFENTYLDFTTAVLDSSTTSSGLLVGQVIGSSNTIENITLENVGIRGTSNDGTGGLIGNISGSGTVVEINNIKASGLKVFSLGENTGGLVGRLMTGSTLYINDIDLEGEVTGYELKSYSGGVIGYVETQATFHVQRGIVEMLSHNTLETDSRYYNKYTMKYLGGVIGRNDSSSSEVSITDVFFTGELVTHTYRTGYDIGTAVGNNNNSVTITNSYAAHVLSWDKTPPQITYDLPVRPKGIMLPHVSVYSMPDSSWWDTFATTFLSSNDLWDQDLTGRLYLVR